MLVVMLLVMLPSHVTHGVSSELHDANGDLLDPITSNAMLSTPCYTSLLHATPLYVVLVISLLVVLSIILYILLVVIVSSCCCS